MEPLVLHEDRGTSSSGCLICGASIPYEHIDHYYGAAYSPTYQVTKTPPGTRIYYGEDLERTTKSMKISAMFDTHRAIWHTANFVCSTCVRKHGEKLDEAVCIALVQEEREELLKECRSSKTFSKKVKREETKRQILLASNGKKMEEFLEKWKK